MRNRAGLAGLLMLATVVAGCGGGTYDKRLEKTIAALESGAPAGGAGGVDPALHPAPLAVTDRNGAATGITVNVPKEFYDASGAPQFAFVPATEPRGVLKGLPAEQTLTTYEYFYADADTGKSLPAYIYFAAVPTSTTEDQLKTMLQQAWGTTGEGTLTINGVEWKSVGGKNNYEYTPREGGTQPFPGEFKAFWRTTPTRHVVVAFNAPEAVVNGMNFMSTADKVVMSAQLNDG